MEFIPGPDFPTGGLSMVVQESFRRIALVVAVLLFVLKQKLNAMKKPVAKLLLFTKLPYQVNKARLIERIAELVKEKKIEGISELRDESDKDGMRIVIEVKSRRNRRSIA